MYMKTWSRAQLVVSTDKSGKRAKEEKEKKNGSGINMSRFTNAILQSHHAKLHYHQALNWATLYTRKRLL